MTTNEVADVLGMAAGEVARLTRDGQLRSTPVGDSVRIGADAIEDDLTSPQP